ncbi:MULTISPECIES: matrixin family metalloprotease [unclassified Paenibacillus]|uniref:matrixin family metalloprotease n=1 Tax=unclassified Paenibacillus TaxID=185978 RepID=UPI003158DE14
MKKGNIHKVMTKKIVTIAALTILSLHSSLFFSLQASAATTSLLSWDLVDSTKHLEWGGSTAYQTSFNAGVNTWENYKFGIIRPDYASTIEDVTLSDYYDIDNYAALTYPSGRMTFNQYRMNQLSSAEKQNVATHELGHALGLEHNTSNDLMYAYVTSITRLSANDKASYDLAYKRY